MGSNRCPFAPLRHFIVNILLKRRMLTEVVLRSTMPRFSIRGIAIFTAFIAMTLAYALVGLPVGSVPACGASGGVSPGIRDSVL